MEPERWQKIERLCYSALNEEESARAAFLGQACGGDEALRRARWWACRSPRSSASNSPF